MLLLTVDSASEREPYGGMSPILPPSVSKSELNRIGRRLARPIGAIDEDVREAFRLAHQWRASHSVPLRSIRQSIVQRAKAHSPLVASRIKRMTSIRSKLEARSLTGIQDIAGCRFIVDTPQELAAVVAMLPPAHRTDDYITEPRTTGYRSHHAVIRYVGSAGNPHAGMQVEAQVRTRLQHAWATAVEAVGLVKQQSLKRGVGDAGWLRFFALMSSEIAEKEGLPLVPGAPGKKARHDEIQALNAELKALATLEAYRVHERVMGRKVGESWRYYIVQFNPLTMEVIVKPYLSYENGVSDYDRAEMGMTISIQHMSKSEIANSYDELTRTIT